MLCKTCNKGNRMQRKMPREKKGEQKHRHPDIYLGKKASGMVTISSPGLHTHTALQQPQHHHSKYCLHEVTHFHPKENHPPLSSSSHSETSSSSSCSCSSSRPYGRDSSKKWNWWGSLFSQCTELRIHHATQKVYKHTNSMPNAQKG